MTRPAALLTVIAALALPAFATASGSTPYGKVFQATISGQVAGLNGKWLLSFAPNGAYSVVKEPAVKTILVGGSSTISGTTLTMTDKTGPNACSGSQAHGSYRWSLSGSTLRLTKIADTCPGRPQVLGSAAFVRVS